MNLYDALGQTRMHKSERVQLLRPLTVTSLLLLLVMPLLAILDTLIKVYDLSLRPPVVYVVCLVNHDVQHWLGSGRPLD
jgi:hypothetical protein